EVQMTEGVDDSVDDPATAKLMSGESFDLEQESFESAGYREADIEEIDDDSSISVAEEDTVVDEL
ncbi:MAG: hypothetical protein J6I65_03740, partial [Lachnospiraceae bacterium]|nr:hypothetical protein [Lachnospiraceae bacterium]